MFCRAGYSVSSQEISDFLNRVRQPFNANSLALFAAEQALEDDEFMNKCLQLNLEQKEVLYKGLETLGFHCLPSKGNFLSFDCREDSTKLFNKLLNQGVIVRTLGVYKMPSFLRVSVGLPEENLIFLEKLKLDYVTILMNLKVVEAPKEIQQNIKPTKIDPKYIGKKMSRNEPCFCGSGKKYKKCCGAL